MSQTFSKSKRSKAYARVASAVFESLESRMLLSTFYVATNGSDSAAGSASAPWKTLQKAANTAVGGDTVVVQPGSYAGMNLVGSGYGGAAGKPITFIANTGDYRTSGVTINAFSSSDSNHYARINIEGTKGWYIIKGFNVTDNGSTQKAGIRVANSQNCQILNNQVSGAFTGIFASLADGILVQGNSAHDSTDQHGIYVNGTDGYTIRNNVCYNNNWDGIHTNVLDGGNTINNNGVIDGNIVYNNVLSGFDITGANNCIFENNIAYGNAKHGLVLQNTNQNPTPACANNVLVNNTFDASGGMYGIEATSGNSNNTTFFNNILLGGSGYSGLGPSISSTAKTSNNITSGSPSTLFVNPGAGDYHLKSGSSAIDAGVASFNGNSAPTIDFEGTARPQGNGFDIGADESGAAATVTVPAAPSGLTATAASSTQVNLKWTDNATNESGYKLLRKTGTGSFTQIATLGTGATSYTDSTAAAGTSYTYEVCAYNSAGDSGYSTASVTTPTSTPTVTVPEAPSGLTATAASASQINLKWTDNSTNETGYKVERATGTGSYALVATLGAGVSSWSDSGLTASTSYSYRVYAYNSAGNSAYSNVASATTQTGTVSNTGWQNHPFTTQTGTFTAEFDAVPTANNEDVVIGLSNGAASGYTGLAAIVRFNPDGVIDVRNGSDYGASTMRYSANTSYHFRMVVNVPQHTYDVYVTPQGGTESLLAKGYAFRSEQSTVSSLSNWAECAAVGNATVSNFAIASTPTVTVPEAPSGLTATAASASQINLKWTDNSTNETGYKVERATGTGSYALVATLGAGVSSWSDSGLTASTSYSYRVYAYNSAGNSAYSNVASATTQAAPTSAASSIWSNSTTPKTLADSDTNAVELGLQFKSDVSGYVTGVRFYKSSTNTGTHVANLWDSAGNLLATATFSGETASGWQTVLFSQPVYIQANTVYTVSYHTNVGHYSANTGYFSSPYASGHLTAIKGVYTYGSKSLFPKSSYMNSNYWVDVLFTQA